MSDVPQGPGWWQASDDKWYPPPRPATPGQVTAGASSSSQGGPSAPSHQAASAPSAPGPMAAPQQTAPQPSAPQPGMHPQPHVPQHHPGVPGGHAATPPPAPAVSPSTGATPSPMGMPAAGPTSPYDLPPVGRPTGGGSDRPMGLYAVLGVLLVGVLVSLFMLVTDDDGGGTTEDTTTTTAQGSSTTSEGDTTTSTDDTSDTTAAPGGGEVVAIDQGVSSFTDTVLEAESYAWGVIVENRSDQVAYSTAVVVDFKDANGTVVDSTETVIQYLLPGQRFGVGDAPFSEVAGVTDLDVRIEPPTEWRDPEGFSEIETGDVDLSYSSSDSPTVSFEAENPYDQRIEDTMAYAILFNQAGDIIGGASTSDIPNMQENGTISASIEVFATVPDIDEGKTQVFIDPVGLS